MRERIIERYIVASKGILGLKINQENFNWSYSGDAPKTSAEEFEKCIIKIEYGVVGSRDERLVSNINKLEGKYHYFRGMIDDDDIFYVRNFAPQRQLLLRAKGLLSNTPSIFANKAYARIVPHRFINLHSAPYLLTDIASLLLLRNGYLSLHCSAFNIDDVVGLVFAPANTGKTMAVMSLCLEHSASFIGEDISISDGEYVHAVPWTSTFRHYSNLQVSFLEKVSSNIVGKYPPLELAFLPFRRLRPITEYIPADEITHKAKITNIVILEKGRSNSITEITPAQAFRKILNLNRYEFSYYKAPIITAHAYFNPKMDIYKRMKCEEEIIMSLCNNVEKVAVLETNSPESYANMILDTLR